jgi:hypothetical protein
MIDTPRATPTVEPEAKIPANLPPGVERPPSAVPTGCQTSTRSPTNQSYWTTMAGQINSGSLNRNATTYDSDRPRAALRPCRGLLQPYPDLRMRPPYGSCAAGSRVRNATPATPIGAKAAGVRAPRHGRRIQSRPRLFPGNEVGDKLAYERPSLNAAARRRMSETYPTDWRSAHGSAH